MKKCQYSEDVGVPEFGPIDGNSQNTSLENWFPISAQELDDLRKQVYLLRESVRAQGIKRYLAEKRAESSERAAEALRAEKDGAYKERNLVVSALSKVFPAVRTKTAIEGWSEDWHSCVYIMLPTGQVSWHYHDSQAYMFEHLPISGAQWDGHDTEEKYRRLAAIDAARSGAKEAG